MERLRNARVPYAWGSRTAIAEFCGERAPSDQPEAEMWMGDHPSAPSVLEEEAGATTLIERIASGPRQQLGEDVCRRFGASLPFLVKVLAAETPLSLQAHPNRTQARSGFEREEAAGLSRTAAGRSYKDPNHKPELLYALGPFDALCGFRPASETVALLEELAAPALAPVLERLRGGEDSARVRNAFEYLMTMHPDRRSDFLDAVLRACREHASSRRADLEWVRRLADLYPGDIGVVSPLMLNPVHLEAGDAMFLGAGCLHSYLRGTAIEVMASSDNVLRGGLTNKHVDVRQLLGVVDFRDAPFATVATRSVDEFETVYATPVEDFRLSILRPGGRDDCRPQRRGPEILLCIEGSVTAHSSDRTLALRRGQSVFVAACEGAYTLTGHGALARATVGDPL